LHSGMQRATPDFRSLFVTSYAATRDCLSWRGCDSLRVFLGGGGVLVYLGVLERAGDRIEERDYVQTAAALRNNPTM